VGLGHDDFIVLMSVSHFCVFFSLFMTLYLVLPWCMLHQSSNVKVKFRMLNESQINKGVHNLFSVCKILAECGKQL